MLPGRIFYLAWDADWRTNAGVAAALRQLAATLTEAGATVRVVDVAPVGGDPKTGIDDSLAHHGADSLRGLLDTSIDAAAIPEPEPAAAVERVAREFPFDGEDVTLLLDAGGWGERDGDRWFVYDVDGAGEDFHAVIRPDTETGGTRLLVLDRAVAAATGLKLKNPAGPFTVLAMLACGGDWKLAGRIAHAYQNNFEGLVAMFEDTRPDPDELAELYPPVPLAGDPVFRTAVEAFKAEPSIPETVVPFGVDSRGRRLAAIIGGSRHGLAVEMEEKTETSTRVFWVQVTRFLAYRTLCETVHGVDETGHSTELLPPAYTVEILRADGHARTRDGFAAKDSVNAKEVVDRLDFGATLPEDLYGVKILENALRTLGYAEREDSVQYTSTGWAYNDDGVPRYQAPLGSITAAGITHTVTVGPPAGSDPTGFSRSMRQTGFDALPDTAAQRELAAASIRAFMRIAPTRPDIGVALLGAVFSAPLRMAGRAAVLLLAPPSSRKSNLASCAQAFFSASPADGKSFAIDVDKSSQVAAEANAAWGTDCLVVADDFRLDADTRKNDTTEGILRGLIQGAYTGASNQRGTRLGGVRASARRADTVLVTGEIFSGGLAIATRAVHLILDRTSVPEFGDGTTPAPLDVFRENFAALGLPRQLMADYLVWLAGQMVTHGGTNPLAWLGTSANTVSGKFRRELQNARTGEVVAAIATGWHYLRRYATARSLTGFLPTEAEVDTALHTLIHDTQAETAAADPGLLTLRKLGEIIGSGRGYLTGHDGLQPRDPGLWGWRWDPSSMGDMGSGYRPGRELVGQVAIDGKHAVISAAGIEFARCEAGLRALKPAQIRQAIAGMVAAGTKPGEKTPAGYLSGGSLHRNRSWVFPLAALGINENVQENFEAEHQALIAANPF